MKYSGIHVYVNRVGERERTILFSSHNKHSSFPLFYVDKTLCSHAPLFSSHGTTMYPKLEDLKL